MVDLAHSAKKADGFWRNTIFLNWLAMTVKVFMCEGTKELVYTISFA